MWPCRVEDPAVCNEIERKNRYEHAFLCNIKKSLRQFENEDDRKVCEIFEKTFKIIKFEKFCSL